MTLPPDARIYVAGHRGLVGSAICRRPEALIRKFHDAKVEGRSEVVIWGSGKPQRECRR